MTACLPARPPSLFPPPPDPPPLFFPDKKFPVEAHLWLDELFYYIEEEDKKQVSLLASCTKKLT